jgi:hypothetical protein
MVSARLLLFIVIILLIQYIVCVLQLLCVGRLRCEYCQAVSFELQSFFARSTDFD